MVGPAKNVFRVDGSATAPINEYRVHGNKVEFRILTPDGRSYPAQRGWRALSHNELLLHFNLNTPVAGWLERIWGWNALRQLRSI